MLSRQLRLIAGLAGCALLLGWGGTLAVRVWDTKVLKEGPDYWQSIYFGLRGRANPGAAPRGGGNFTGNEHAEISDIALRRLGAEVFSMAMAEHMVTDLNASYFHPELMEKSTYPAGSMSAGLEQRLLPPPPHFSGTPDFSYTLYDWVDKNTRCPPLPDGTVKSDECYRFIGWSGALNSSHFGQQAELFYKHLHGVAMSLAAHAKSMGEKLSQNAAEQEAYKKVVQEAELMALSYEAYAQHFLEDRWASGHMWNRWGSPQYQGEDYLGYIRALAVGAITGVIHGHESSSGSPDLMSSPSGSTFSEWKGDDGIVYQAVGDHRLEDAFDGSYGGVEVNVPTQRDRMLMCAMAGWAEVIRGFGQMEGKRGFGIYEASVGGYESGFGDVPFDCWNAWATNQSLWQGWSVPTFSTIGGALISLGVAVGTHPKVLVTAGVTRTDLLSFVHRLRLYSLLSADGTNLAQGDIGTLLYVKPGDDYLAIPSWLETNVETWPDSETDATSGRSKEVIMGFFNCAYADRWCLEGTQTLMEARSKSDEMSQATCRYLADRLYRGTDTTYAGRHVERRTVDGRQRSAEILPMCAALGAEPEKVDSLPVWLHPGYVLSPYGTDHDGYWSAPNNWCARVPVVDLIEDPIYPNSGPAERPEERIFRRRNPDLVGDVDGAATINITGADFGDRQGTVRLTSGFYGDTLNAAITEWSDNAISFRAETSDSLKVGYWHLVVGTADGRQSVGWFDLRVRLQPASVVDVKVSQGADTLVSRATGREEPLRRGMATTKIVFSQDMDTTVTAIVRLVPPGGPDGPRTGPGVPAIYEYEASQSIAGGWVDRVTWQGLFVVNGDEASEGRHRMSIDARTLYGFDIDVDPIRARNQPDTATILRFEAQQDSTSATPDPPAPEPVVPDPGPTALAYPVVPREFDPSIGASGVWFSETALPRGGVVGHWWHVTHDPVARTFHAAVCDHDPRDVGGYEPLDQLRHWMPIAEWGEEGQSFAVRFHGSYEPVRGMSLQWPNFLTMRGSFVEFEWRKTGPEPEARYDWLPASQSSTRWQRLVPTIDSARVEHLEGYGGTRWKLRLWGDDMPIHSFTRPEFEHLIKFDDPQISLVGSPEYSTRTSLAVTVQVPTDAPTGTRPGYLLGRRFDRLLDIRRPEPTAPATVISGEGLPGVPDASVILPRPDQQPAVSDTTPPVPDPANAAPLVPAVPWNQRWEVYRVDERTLAGRPDPWVIRARFSQRDFEGRLEIEEFPVSSVRNETSGAVFFSVNWSAGETISDQRGTMAVVEAAAAQARAGSMARSELDAVIRRFLTGG